MSMLTIVVIVAVTDDNCCNRRCRLCFTFRHAAARPHTGPKETTSLSPNAVAHNDRPVTSQLLLLTNPAQVRSTKRYHCAVLAVRAGRQLWHEAVSLRRQGRREAVQAGRLIRHEAVWACRQIWHDNLWRQNWHEAVRAGPQIWHEALSLRPHLAPPTIDQHEPVPLYSTPVESSASLRAYVPKVKGGQRPVASCQATSGADVSVHGDRTQGILVEAILAEGHDQSAHRNRRI